jgi:hypothetical protein
MPSCSAIEIALQVKTSHFGADGGAALQCHSPSCLRRLGVAFSTAVSV